jgi:hypothetical protein
MRRLTATVSAWWDQSPSRPLICVEVTEGDLARLTCKFSFYDVAIGHE